MLKKILCMFIAAVMLSTMCAFAIAEEEISFMPQRMYNGVTYEGRTSNELTTVLLIGYDHNDGGQLVDNPEGFIYGGQSDFLLLLAFDHEKKQIRQLQINRDTMTNVKYYYNDGSYYGLRELQICLAHAYGDTQEVNNRNAIWAVENLLGIAKDKDGAQIDWYISMDFSGIAKLNDLLGGVTVTVTDDFSELDPTLVMGETITLTGAQAHNFCRGRHHVADQTNMNRMARQRTYMKAASQKLLENLRSDANFAVDLLYGMGLIFDETREVATDSEFAIKTSAGTPVTDTPTHFLMTNRSINGIISLMNRAMDYEICEVETLPGINELGSSGYMEFRTEEDAGLKWALDALYTPRN